VTGAGCNNGAGNGARGSTLPKFFENNIAGSSGGLGITSSLIMVNGTTGGGNGTSYQMGVACPAIGMSLNITLKAYDGNSGYCKLYQIDW